MWTKKDKSITLTESVTLSLESLKQAIQIWFGREIVFVENTELSPRKINRHESGTESRYVMMEAMFCFLDGTSEEKTTRVYAEVDLVRNPHVSAGVDRWQVDRIHFGLGELEEPKRTWCWSHVIGEEPVLPTIKVGLEMGKEAPDYNWRVGRTVADRRLEPWFPKAS